jgi:hypothetical protein
MAILDGRIETISGRVMSGWINADTTPAHPLNIELLDNGLLLGATLMASLDGTPVLSFEFLLPRAIFDGAAHEFSARVDGIAIPLANAAHTLTAEFLAEPPPATPPVGWLEMISEKGWVQGWAWYPDRPDERVELEMLVDGAPAGTTIAMRLREDVLNAGHGDGRYGFSWPLPYQVLAQPRDVTITARDKKTGYVLPEPRLFRRRVVVDAMRKINDLEDQLRLLTATLDGVERRAAASNAGTAELFKTVGDFFTQLASLAEAGEPPSSLRLLKSAADELAAIYPPFAFRPAPEPEISILLEAAGPASAIYETLQAVFETIGDMPAEIILLDSGACEEAPLLPAIVQNIRYARLPGSPVARANDAARLAAAPLLVFITAGISPAAYWTDELSPFSADPALAALAARITTAEGTIISAGMDLTDGDLLPRGEGFLSADPAFNVPSPVSAPDPAFCAIRRAAWLAQNGLDEDFSSLPPALAELLVRAKTVGASALYSPPLIGIAHLVLPPTTSPEASRLDQSKLRALSEASA